MHFDFIVIGAGIAGLSVAAELSSAGAVAVIERESQPGYHSTGRSAALYSEIYGNATIRALTRASRSFYYETPGGFSDSPLVSKRGSIYFAAHWELNALDRFADELRATGGVTRLDAAQTRELVPAFKPDYLGGSLYERESADIDVAAVLQGFAVVCRRNGVALRFDSNVTDLRRDGDEWTLSAGGASLTAPIIVNAAGAWGDVVATMGGVRPVGLVPKRRTAVLIEVPLGANAAAWPAAIHVGESFYFKPDAGLLLLSPADETPTDPSDVQPEELDIAIAVDRFETATGTSVRKLRSSWAGLRSFVADKTPVVGFDPVAPGFFWLVGQGGYGIQTAPAMARVASALVQRQELPADLLEEGVTADALAPNREGLKAF